MRTLQLQGPRPGALPGLHARRACRSRCKSGKLDADLKIDFEQAATCRPQDHRHRRRARRSSWPTRRAATCCSFDSLEVALADVRPLERFVHLGEVALAAPQLVVARDAAGRLNLLATDPATGADGRSRRLRSRPEPPNGAASRRTRKPWQVQVDKLALSGGHVGWRDETTRRRRPSTPKQLAIEVSGDRLADGEAGRFNGATAVGGAALKFQGEATDKVATVQAEVDGLPLSLAAPYLAQSLEPTLDGKLSGQVEVAWNQPDAEAQRARRVGRRPGADAGEDRAGERRPLRAGRCRGRPDRSDTIAIAIVHGDGSPKIRVERDSEKRWMFERWLKAPPPASERRRCAKDAPRPRGCASAVGAGASTQALGLDSAMLALDNGTRVVCRQGRQPPVAFEISALDAERAEDRCRPAPCLAAAAVRPHRRGPRGAGPFRLQGHGGAEAAVGRGRLELVVDSRACLQGLLRAMRSTSTSAARSPATGQGQVRDDAGGHRTCRLAGDTAIEDFRANSAIADPVARCRARQPVAALEGAEPARGCSSAWRRSAPLSVDVRETTLTDFFARVIIDPTGRLNLLDLRARSPASPAPTAAAASAPAASTRRGAGGHAPRRTRLPRMPTLGASPVPAEADGRRRAQRPAAPAPRQPAPAATRPMRRSSTSAR